MPPSRLHELVAWAVPRVRKSRDLETVEGERDRLERWHAGLQRSLPTRAVPRFHGRFSVVIETLTGPRGQFPAYVVTPRGIDPERTVVFVHGGGFVAPLDPFHVRYATRLATALRARVVLPDYPLTPEHTWRDSHAPLVDLVARWVADSDAVVLAGDSSGGGLALSLAVALRDRGGPQPAHLLLHAPWVDLTTSTAGHGGVLGDGPVAVPRQAARVRRVVGGVGGRPRPPGGVARAGPAGRAAAGADVLRHPGHAGAGVPTAGDAGRRVDLGPDLRGGAGPDPRVPAAAARPRGAARVAPDGGVPAMTVRVLAFDDLDARAAYDVWRLRQDVFVVEQACPYPDLDGRDPEPGTRHVLLEGADGALLGYLRLLDDGDVARIGRVVLAPAARGRGLADGLMHAALAECGARPVVLDAQTPLAGWYAGFGFSVSGPEFLEDGIAHVPMRREGTDSPPGR